MKYFGMFSEAYLIGEPNTDRFAKAITNLKSIGIEPVVIEAIIPESSAGFGTIGEHGCYLAHLKALRLALQAGYGNILIFEDDVIFVDDFTQRFPAVVDQLQTVEWDLFYLHARYRGVVETLTPNLFSAEIAYQTHAYAVSGRKLREIIAFVERGLTAIKQPIDNTYMIGKYRIVQSYPTLAAQDPSFSLIYGKPKNNLFLLSDNRWFYENCSTVSCKLNDKCQLVLPNVIDLNLNWRGVGDVIMAAAFAKRHVQDHPNQRMRIVVSGRDMEWVRLFWNDFDYSMSGVVGQYIYPITSDPLLLPKSIGRTAYDIFADVLNLPYADPTTLELSISSDAMETGLSVAASARRESGRQKLIFVAPYCRDLNRAWPTHRWIELTTLLHKSGYAVLTDMYELPAMAEFAHGMTIGNLAPETLCALISQCDMVISNNSGPAYIAGALNKLAVVPCAVFDGVTAFGVFKSVHWIQSKFACSACYRLPERGFVHHCNSGCEALWHIQASEVFQKVKELLPA